MTRTSTSTDTNALRELADILDASPGLPAPYVNGYGPVKADWFLSIHGQSLAEQKVTAAQIVRSIGGRWDKNEHNNDFRFTRATDQLILRVTVARDAVCERVVTGTTQVTVPATAAVPAQPGHPEHVEIVETVKWVCGSVLADTELVSA